jgi:diguanylate cyclase (GGDEF)-like protein
MAVYLTEHGYGPFANTAALGMSRNLAVQIYLGFHLIGFLPISTLFREQRWMHKELRESLARTTALASLDGLTNVANRRTLDAHLDEQWRLAIRAQTSLAWLMIDADHFKQFNDRFGHRAGDDCLRLLATTMRAQVSRPADMVARFGGEEFAVLLPNTPLEGAKVVAEAIRAAVCGLTLEGRQITVSIGCAAVVPQPNTQSHRLIELADQALYLAKKGGRNRVCVTELSLESWSPGTASRKLRERIERYRRSRRERGAIDK